MTGLPLAEVALALLAAVAEARGERPQDGAAQAPPQRWLEVDAPAFATLGIAAEELAAELGAAGFAGVVVWLDSGSSSPPGLPREPRCRLLAASESPPLEPESIPAAWARAGLAVAAGAIDDRAARSAAADPIPRAGSVTIELGPDGAPLVATRLCRPAVRSLAWCDPGFAARSLPKQAAAVSISTRWLAPVDPALRAQQARLDLRAFAARPSAVEPALLAQSRLASALAERLGGGAPCAYLPLENEWIGTHALAARLAPPRDEVASLDLDELLFSVASDGTTALERALGALPPLPPLAGLIETGGRADATSAAAAGVLPIATTGALARCADARAAAAASWARHLAGGPEPERESARAALAAAASQLPPLGGLAVEWGRVLAADAELVDTTLPWRIRRVRWQLFAPGDGDGQFAESVAADDPRLRGFAPVVERALGGRSLDLSRFRSGERIRFETVIALRDPRLVRIEAEPLLSATLLLNGEPLRDLPSGRGDRLQATLSLPAGRNVLALEAVPGPDSRELRVDLTRPPLRTDGIVLLPANASRVTEPVVRLSDPGALDEASFVWPRGRAASAAGPGGAVDLPFTLSEAGTLDAWLRVLVAEDSAGEIGLSLDGGPAQRLALRGSGGWRWHRLPAPLPAAGGSHALHVELRTPELRLDHVVLLRSELELPREPDGAAPLAATAWRFDPLGSGLVVDLPGANAVEPFGRTFSVDRTGSFELFAWLDGSRPLLAGEHAELELASTSARQRFVLSPGAPHEEWISLGVVPIRADERIELEARGSAALARIALVR